MGRVLLLCFVHGFKGTDNSFEDFPKDLTAKVASTLPDHHVESAVYPQYETRGELGQSTQAFLEWVKERVMEIRKTHVKNPWPANDREVGVIFVSHSMGGFVAADALFLALSERDSQPNASENELFPLIQGILAFDTPYNGLARSMFAYGAFSNYQKVSTAYSAITALTAMAPASLSRMGTKTSVASAASTSTAPSRGPQWATWQLLAMRTGTVGAIAAGGVAAYMNREAIINGVKNVRNINKESIAEGYRQTVDTLGQGLGQGLAYFNRGNVGKSYAYLSDHFTFIGALLKQKEMSRRLERLGALKGVGLHDYYVSLGENGYWSGGYFVPERTFCAVPEKSHSAHDLFSRQLLPDSKDEVEAHVNVFSSKQHPGYEKMTESSAELIKEWFYSTEPIVDDERFREAAPEEAAEDSTVEKVLKGGDANPSEEELSALDEDAKEADSTAQAEETKGDEAKGVEPKSNESKDSELKNDSTQPAPKADDETPQVSQPSQTA